MLQIECTRHTYFFPHKNYKSSTLQTKCKEQLNKTMVWKMQTYAIIKSFRQT